MSIDWPRITIVTPSFRHAQYIEATIESVLSQNYPNLEYFVMDGGSKDGTVDILKKYDSQLTGWVSENDRGQTHAINKGFERATGEIRAYLNSDDIYLPGALKAIADRYIKADKPGILHGRIKWLNETGDPLDQPPHFGNITNYAEMLDLWRVWWRKRQWVQPEVFWSATAAEKVGPFDEDRYYAMDFDYWVRLMRNGERVERVEHDISGFRFTPIQKSNQSDKAADELRDIVRREVWDSTAPLDPSERRRLKGWIYFDSEFRPLANKSAATGEGRLKRWAKLGAFCLAHPQIFQVPALWRRVFTRGKEPTRKRQ